MAFGEKSSSGSMFGPNTKVFYAKLKTKDLPAPVWEIAKKEGDNFVVVDPAAKFVSGNVVALQNKETKFEKKTIKSVTVVLFDPKEDMAIYAGVPHTYLGRNILNSLLSLKTFNGVEIGVYQSKPKPDPKNPGKMRPGYASSAVRQGGQLVYGKFKNEELPKIPKVQVGDQLFSDDTEITKFFITQIDELAKVVKANPSAQQNATPAAAPAATGTATQPKEQEVDDDIPF